MTLRFVKYMGAAAALALIALPSTVQAHRQWMLPSSTIVAGDDVWVTVDAAVSNDLFYFEHQPLRLDNVKAWAPDGSELKMENASTGRYRSTFDLHLTQKGTYRIVNAGGGLIGTYKDNGEEKRLPRGTTAETLAKALPAGATDLKLSESWSRNEVFVTSGGPTEIKAAGKGLELVPVTHPNDLVAGEEARFRFTIDGKPAAGIAVTVVPGGIRYRDQLNQIDLKTDGEGVVTLTLPEPGHYWLNAVARDAVTSDPRATERRMSYVTTLEALPL